MIVSYGGVIYMGDSPTDYVKDGYQKNPDVYSIISRIARKAAEARWTLYSAKDMQTQKAFQMWGANAIKSFPRLNGRKALEEVDTHDFYKLWYEPNPNQTQSEFIEAAVAFRLLIGNSYILKWSPDMGLNKGKTTRLEVLPAHYVGIKTGPTGVEGYTLYLGKNLEFPAEKVMHTKYFNPEFSAYGAHYYGQSPIRAGRLLVQRSNDTFTAAVKLLQNSGAVGILSSEKIGGGDMQSVPDNELVKRLQEDLEKNYSGPESLGRKIVSGHPWKWVQLGMSAVDMALIESAKLNTKQICNLFQFPPELLGDQDSAKFNSFKEAKKSLVTDCVIPELTALRDILNKQFISKEYPDVWLDFDVSHFPEMQEDMLVLSQRMAGEWWWTPNEKREMAGRDPLPDGNMNQIWKPMGIEPLAGDIDPDAAQDELKRRGIDGAYN